MSGPPLLRTYVDETGDRGILSKKSSRFFAMVSMTVADEDEPAMRGAIATARRDLGVPPGKPLHWVDHVKTFSRRQHVTSLLAPLPVVLNVVIFEKASIPPNSVMRTDQGRFYNYVAGLLLERVLRTAQGWPGGPRGTILTFGHVRGFDHQETSNYFGVKQWQEPSLPWSLLHAAPKFSDTGAYDGLQAADAYAGMLHKAIVADEFGGYEHQHFLAVRHRLRRSPGGRCLGYGFKAMVGPTTLRGFPWWPVQGL